MSHDQPDLAAIARAMGDPDPRALAEVADLAAGVHLAVEREAMACPDQAEACAACGAIAIWMHRVGVRMLPAGRCWVCGCVDEDCTACVEITGEPCYWTDETRTVCSRCAPDLAAFASLQMRWSPTDGLLWIRNGRWLTIAGDGTVQPYLGQLPDDALALDIAGAPDRHLYSDPTAVEPDPYGLAGLDNAREQLVVEVAAVLAAGQATDASAYELADTVCSRLHDHGDVRSSSTDAAELAQLRADVAALAADADRDPATQSLARRLRDVADRASTETPTNPQPITWSRTVTLQHLPPLVRPAHHQRHETDSSAPTATAPAFLTSADPHNTFLAVPGHNGPEQPE